MKVKLETKCSRCLMGFYMRVDYFNLKAALADKNLYCPKCKTFTGHAEGYPKEREYSRKKD